MTAVLARSLALSLLVALLTLGAAEAAARPTSWRSPDVIYGGVYGAPQLNFDPYDAYAIRPDVRSDVPVYVGVDPSTRSTNAQSRYRWTSSYSPGKAQTPPGLRIRIDPSNGEMFAEIPESERNDLPLMNVFDPLEHRNKPITDYSYEQLVAMMGDAGFRRWNELPALCASLEALYDRVPTACGGTATPVSISPRTARAYTDRRVIQQPTVAMVGPQVRIVDPVYPPWSPTYDPYW